MVNSVTLGKQGRRETVKAANRQAILQAAREVFVEMGFEAATVRDVIRRTELASGTFYNYFKSKEELFDALSAEVVKRFRPYMAHARSNADSFERYIEGIFRAYFTYLAEELVGGEDMHLLSRVRLSPPEARMVFKEVRAAIAQEIELYAGEAPLAELDAEYLTAAIVGTAREMGVYMMQRQPVDVEMATRLASTLFLGGFSALRAGTDKLDAPASLQDRN